VVHIYKRQIQALIVGILILIFGCSTDNAEKENTGIEPLSKLWESKNFGNTKILSKKESMAIRKSMAPYVVNEQESSQDGEIIKYFYYCDTPCNFDSKSNTNSPPEPLYCYGLPQDLGVLTKETNYCKATFIHGVLRKIEYIHNAKITSVKLGDINGNLIKHDEFKLKKAGH